MAKVKMLCPFSQNLCQECAQYRDRHYYLCFCEKYRGYMGSPEQQSRKELVGHFMNEEAKALPILPRSSTWFVVEDF